MTNLEHLIENGLCAMENCHGHKEWYEHMEEDVNWQGNENISMDNLWEICQYIIYTWKPCRIDNSLN